MRRDGSSDMACASGTFDLDPGVPGCEYACSPSSGADRPDSAFADTNCDGIDGDLARAVFVSPGGNDANAGTMESPLRTVSAAIDLASSTSRDVYVDAGTYNESLELADGVSVYGGFDRTTRPAGTPAGYWNRGLTSVSRIVGGTRAVEAAGLTRATTLDRLTIEAADGSATSPASIAVWAHDSDTSGVLRVTACAILAGDGADGVDGASGAAGARGADAVGSSGGTGCARGGAGGAAPACGDGPSPGVAGRSGGGLGARGGDGGDGADILECWTSTDAFISGRSGEAGVTGTTPVTVGRAGTSGGTEGTVVASDWRTDDGTDGGDGGDGVAGSGGGSGGCGGQVLPLGAGCLWTSTAGAGGGGGGAGCGGDGGRAGSGGGASIGVLAVDATVQLMASTVTTGTGGDGGDGGAAGSGGRGGDGAEGGEGTAGGRSGGDGSDGTGGADGGDAGGGGGGPSVCLAHAGTGSITQTGTSLTHGVAGRAGDHGDGTTGILAIAANVHEL